jgi:hypothetical protein
MPSRNPDLIADPESIGQLDLAIVGDADQAGGANPP